MDHPGSSLHPFPCDRGLPWPRSLSQVPPPCAGGRGGAPRRARRPFWQALLLFGCGALLPLLAQPAPGERQQGPALSGTQVTRSDPAPHLAALAHELRQVLSGSSTP